MVGTGILIAPDATTGVGVGLGLVCVGLVFAITVVITVVVARAARGRRPVNELYEDAWARLAVELWPAPRYRGHGAFTGSAASYSRTEFLIAVRDGSDLERFSRHAPFTRNP